MYSNRTRVLLIALAAAGTIGTSGTSPLQAQESRLADEKTTDVKSMETKSVDVWERLIYLPYKNLKSVFDKQEATVLVPYFEYLKLWEQSVGGTRPMPHKPLVSAVITESHYTGKVDKNLVRIEAAFTVQVLENPWAEVPIRFGKAAVGKMTSSNGQVLLRGTGNGSYSLLLPNKGEHKVQLELVTRVRTSPEGRSFEIQCPTVGITTFELSIPEPDQTVKVAPHLVSLPTKAAETETSIKASVGSTRRITVHWHPRAGLKPEMNLLTTVTNFLQISIEEGLMHADATLE